MTRYLSRQGHRAGLVAAREYRKRLPAEKLAKADEEGIDLSDIGLDDPVPDEFTASLRAIFADSGAEQAAGLVDNPDSLFNLTNEAAVKYSQTRSGELIGQNGGEWAISDTTRDGIASLIETAFSEGLSPRLLSEEIVSSYAFSEARADMIARTELALASVTGALDTWKESGVVTGKQWILGSEHDVPDECDDNDGVVVGLDEAFPSGDDGPPAHPNCVCDILSVTESEG
jgi:SPP1 gp7 family putative phage head morphogenesis protein